MNRDKGSSVETKVHQLNRDKGSSVCLYLLTMAYCIPINTMKYLDLFDDIPHKYIKNIIDKDDEYIDVDITDLECDRIAWCNTQFTFKLDINVSGGSLPLMVEKTFKRVLHYNNSSGIALTIMNIQDEEDDDEEDDEEDEDNKDEDNEDDAI